MTDFMTDRHGANCTAAQQAAVGKRRRQGHSIVAKSEPHQSIAVPDNVASIAAGLFLLLCAAPGVQAWAGASQTGSDGGEGRRHGARVEANSLMTDTIFGPRSFWYAPIPKTVELHPNSAAYVGEFLRQKAAYYGSVIINTYSYASAVYVADRSTPTQPVRVSDCQGKGYIDANLTAQWSAVPIPLAARASKGDDREMTVYQPSTGTLWEFWQAKSINGRWEACWGGRMKNVSSSSGLWPHPYGTTATGLPFVGGQITAEELKRGEIRHVIGIALVDLETATIFSWPASRSDGTNPNKASNRIPAGTRFRLNPSINVDALKISPVAKIIAKAAQRYGFVVWDKAGALSLRAQNADAYTALGNSDPYPALYQGKPAYAVLDGFPWEELQFLPKDYGNFAGRRDGRVP